MTKDGGSQGVNSAMLTSMQQAGSGGGGAGAGIANPADISAKHMVDGMGNLDSLSLGDMSQIQQAFPATFDDNALAVFDGSILSQGGVSHEGFSNIGFMGNTSFEKLGPGSQLNIENVPALSSKGRQQG